jgi:hypothetical protein
MYSLIIIMQMVDNNDDVRVVMESAMNSEDPSLRTFVSTTYDDETSSELDNSREDDKQLPPMQTEYKKKKIVISVICCIIIIIALNVGFFYLISPAREG